MHSPKFLAKPVDMSQGFKDFFDTIGLTGSGIITKAIPAVIVVVALGMLGMLINRPQNALRKGLMAIGALFVAVILSLYGDVLFSTVTGGGGKKN